MVLEFAFDYQWTALVEREGEREGGGEGWCYMKAVFCVVGSVEELVIKPT